jgi:hypothetical protein
MLLYSLPMRGLLALAAALLLGGCYSTITLADGTVCRKYEPQCGFLMEDRLVCETDEDGCETCTCVPKSGTSHRHEDRESGRNSYMGPEG